MKKILFLTVGNRKRPSARYRALQYIPLLSQYGFNIEVMPPNKKASSLLKRTIDSWKSEKTILEAANKSDLIFIQKKLFRIRFIKKLLRTSIPIIFDLDDTITTTYDNHWSSFTSRRIQKRFEFICSHANLVITGNSYLTDLVSPYTRKIVMIPTVVDTSRYSKKNHNTGDTIALGWMGHPVNFPFLEEINPALTKISKRHPNVSLLVVSHGQPSIIGIPMKCIEWDEINETEDLLLMDIGLMPLPNNHATRGKCALKGIQYMAAGLPVVYSDVGINKDVIRNNEEGLIAANNDEWETCLESLITNKTLRKRLGQSGKHRATEEYSLTSSTAILITHIEQLIEN